MKRYVPWFVFHSLSFYLNVFTSVWLYYHSLYVSWSESLSLFLWRFVFGYNYWDWLYVYTYVSWSAFVSLSLSFSLSQRPGILLVICMYVNKCDQLTQRVIALKIYLFDFACIRTFLDSYFFLSLCLWMCVAVSSYITTQCRCKYASLVIRVPHSLCCCCWMYVSMFGPFVTDCTCIGTCIGTSPDPFLSLSLSLCLSQCAAVLPVICMYMFSQVVKAI